MLHAIIETLSPSDDIIATEHLFITREEYAEREAKLSSLQVLFIISEDIL